jgi:hypothetical protein
MSVKVAELNIMSRGAGIDRAVFALRMSYGLPSLTALSPLFLENENDSKRFNRTPTKS